ncbi:Sel1 repeat protein [Caballeronia cordobensis]|uniref:Sel1 repeat protein n=1 Tax=Caballeronia cordobensis TaxID=1353886 RepID=A0A158IX29_CABCO|nr:Sel1 repeat protein [Caballeronia cordobensis]
MPPAKLPPWDGTFEWQKRQDAVVPPQKPSDELVNRLAKEKGLDPATGLRVSGLPGDPLPDEKSGAPTPSGYMATNAEQSFRKEEKLPLLAVGKPRPFALLDSMLGARRMHVDGIWRRISYRDDA